MRQLDNYIETMKEHPFDFLPRRRDCLYFRENFTEKFVLIECN